MIEKNMEEIEGLEEKKESSVAAMISVGLGVIATICCFLGWVIPGPIAGLAGVIIASRQRKRLSSDNGRGIATCGLTFSAIGLILNVFMLIMLAATVGAYLNGVQ